MNFILNCSEKEDFVRHRIDFILWLFCYLATLIFSFYSFVIDIRSL
jgi:hypothetical protein